jgi:transposase
VPKPFRSPDLAVSPENERHQHALEVAGASVESTVKRVRRRFSAAEKLRIVKEADSCLASGERGALEALLRKEAIYSSLLSSWRAQLGSHGAAGLAPKKAGRKPKLSEAERRNVELLKRNAVLERKLHIANVLIALQKKAHEVLGLALPESDGDT